MQTSPPPPPDRRGLRAAAESNAALLRKLRTDQPKPNPDDLPDEPEDAR